MTAKQLDKIVKGYRGKVYLKLENRFEVEKTVFFVAALLKEAGYVDAALSTENLCTEIDDIDTMEIVKEGTFRD